MVRIFQVIKIAFLLSLILREREKQKLSYHQTKRKNNSAKTTIEQKRKIREREKKMFTKLIKIAQSDNSPKNKVSSLFY